MNAVALIPARGGSQRISRKNLKEFHGNPIISYSIETAQQSELFDRIVVSTDDEEIAEVAAHYGADVYHRDPEYGRNEVGTQEVARECLEGLDYRGECACVIYATAPLMSVEDLKQGYEDYIQNEHGGFAFSVGYPPLCDAAQFYFGDTQHFLQNYPLVSSDTVMVLIAPERVCDINTTDDWSRAEEMYAKLEETEHV